MHVPDGFLNLPVSIATGVVATASVAVSIVSARRRPSDDRTAPVVGIVAVVIFSAQMMNFPVGAGTSGHLIGATLATALLGPALAIPVMACVLIVQALLFADGGITALGTNITLMGLVAVGVATLILAGLRRVLPRTRGGVLTATAIAAFVSVPVAAAAFVLLFAIGGQAPVDLGAVFSAMVGWHLLIGIGEAVITTLVVGAVLATRPDLVVAARHIRTAAPAASAPASTTGKVSA